MIFKWLPKTNRNFKTVPLGDRYYIWPLLFNIAYVSGKFM